MKTTIITISTRVLTSPLPITQRIFFPLLNRVMPPFSICGRESSYHFRRASKDLLRLTLLWYKPLSFSYGNYVTWDQAQFSFRFGNIAFWRARRNQKRAWYKPSTKRLRPLFWLIDICWISQPKLLPLLVLKTAQSLTKRIVFTH